MRARLAASSEHGFSEQDLVLPSLSPPEVVGILLIAALTYGFLVLFLRKLTPADAMVARQAALFANAQRIGQMGSWSLDLRTGAVVWPAETCHLFGIAAAEFGGTFEHFRAFILPEDLAGYDAACARTSASERLFEAEYRIRRPDGEVRWMYSRGRVDVDASGTAIGRTGMIMDMTDQHVANEQLAEHAALLRIAGRVARLGGWTIQLPSRTLTWSDENCAIHDVPAGYKPTLDEGIGYYPPEYRAEVTRHVEACEREGTPYDFELPKITAAGRHIWVRSIGEAVRDADGRIVRLQGAFQDISARRQAQEELRERAAEFRTLAESMPQMVWIMRPDGSNIYFNQQWVDYTGLSRDESYGDGWHTPFHPDDRERAAKAWQGANAAGDYNVQCRLRRADGSYRWMLVRGLPLRDSGGAVTKWIGTCTDIDELKQAQEAALTAAVTQRDLATQLETERARLVAAQAVASVGSWETDLATRAVIWSAETYRIFEITPAGFDQTYAAFLQLLHPDDRDVVDHAFVQSIDGHMPGAIEHRLVMPDGRVKFIEERWQMMCDTWGQPTRATGTCQDITARRRAQEALRMQAHMLDHIGQAVIATDTSGRVTYANRCASELYGWSSADIVGQVITDVTVPQITREQGVEIMAHLQRGETWSGEFLVQNRAGRVFPALVTDSAVLDERGQMIGIVGISTDISTRKQSEEEIRLKNALIRMAGKVTRTGGWAVDMPGERVSWSDEVLDILDYPSTSVPQLSDVLALYLEPSREIVAAAIGACARQGTPFDMEAEILTKTGKRKWVRVSAEPERYADGSVRRVQGALQDIAERKQLEQQYLRAQRMESIGTLAGGIAHDLNNVLAPVLLSIAVLQQDEHDAARLATLDTIESSARRGAAMISRVLAFARGMEGERVDVQVMPLVRDLVTIVRDTFPKNIELVEHISPELRTLHADPTQLHQVLLNMCVNARDAMPLGGRITITAQNVVVDEAYAAVNIDARIGPYVVIDLEDTGSGMSKAVLDQIFDPFFTTKEIGKGTGLGLATSLAIVKGHEGFIRASSTPGMGTRFRLYLPAQTTPVRREPTVAAASRPRGNGETVLVVDDEVAIRQIARRMLEGFGYRVLLASDGAEAVALYAEHRAVIAVVVTDMMMPVMDGAATIRELLRLDPNVRIIAASGLAGADEVVAAGGNAARFLAKPYSAETLLTAIKASLP
jgi:PAS domain S-box-containing protein